MEVVSSFNVRCYNPNMSRQEKLDLTKLRYVLYARKSTEDENRQVRSIDDQIRDCQKLANELNLRVTDIIREPRSAKKPGKRPLFTQMMQDLAAKKYDAILCWHPDRLCRNMLEGGQIINMLDENELKDIRFHSHQFSNDANGKMLLGMLFVFSKQYSDDLSDKVSRGVHGNLDEGKSAGTPKLGYTRSEVTGLYEPSEFYDAIKEAWHKRLAGESLEAVTTYVLAQGVHRVTKNVRNQRTLKPTKSTIGNMFHDPFYYGLLIQSGRETDLREITNFQSMITEDQYNQVQALGYGRTRDLADRKRATFYPLRGMVFCDVCYSSKYMVVGKNKTGSGKYVLSYRCDNKQCTRSPKSFRAKHVFNSIYSTLEKLELSDAAYERYGCALDERTEEKIDAIKQDLRSKRGALAHIQNESRDLALRLGKVDETSPIYKPNEERLEDLTTKQIKLEDEIRKLEEKVTTPAKIKLSKDEFLNLAKTAADKMKAGSAVEKDALARILFLNLRVDNEKVASYLWREPFATLVKATEIESGGGGWT
jgi:site-specific DNA recombinase